MSEPAVKKQAMSSLEQLKAETIVVADSGDIDGNLFINCGWGNGILTIHVSI